MSTITYGHTIGGKGTAKGLPLRRASQLYDVEPGIRYPNVLSTATDSDMHTYDRAIYLRVPHLPVTFVKEPYVNNHKAGGNFTRRQYFVIKRGQPLMASTKREPTIGIITAAGSVATRQYVDPTKIAGEPTLIGYKRLGYIATAEAPTTESREGATVVTAVGDEANLITPAEFDALDSGTQSNYQVDTNIYAIEYFDTLDADLKEDARGAYVGGEDTNDKIPTGGVDQYAEVEEALFGSTDIVKFVEINADAFFFNAATRSEGFIYPSTGGAPRTVFFNEVDQEAMVTLPVGESGDGLRVVQPLGNVSDVSASNAASYRNSVVVLQSRPTIGFAHTDLEQTTSHQFHQFSTGTDVHTPVRKGRLQIPFIDIVKLKEIVDAKLPAGSSFKFTDLTGGKSGIKVGVFGDSVSVDVQNTYSLLTDEDAGYANLYFNFAAPFMVTDHFPKLHEKIVPDLFGNYTHFGAGAIDAAASVDATAGTNPFGLAEGVANANLNGSVTANEAHVCGRILNIYDMPRRSGLLDLQINPIWQSRITGDTKRNALNEGYRRVRGADNAGLEPILSDFLFMLLGGSSYDWAAQLLPKFGHLPQDLANVIEELVIEGAAGLVEIEANVLI